MYNNWHFRWVLCNLLGAYIVLIQMVTLFVIGYKYSFTCLLFWSYVTKMQSNKKYFILVKTFPEFFSFMNLSRPFELGMYFAQLSIRSLFWRSEIFPGIPSWESWITVSAAVRPTFFSNNMGVDRTMTILGMNWTQRINSTRQTSNAPLWCHPAPPAPPPPCRRKTRLRHTCSDLR